MNIAPTTLQSYIEMEVDDYGWKAAIKRQSHFCLFAN
jgi:hypothetical protein